MLSRDGFFSTLDPEPDRHSKFLILTPTDEWIPDNKINGKRQHTEYTPRCEIKSSALRKVIYNKYQCITD